MAMSKEVQAEFDHAMQVARETLEKLDDYVQPPNPKDVVFLADVLLKMKIEATLEANVEFDEARREAGL